MFTASRFRPLLVLLAASLIGLAIALVTRLQSEPRLVALPGAALSPFLAGSVHPLVKTPEGVRQLAEKRDPLVLFDSAFKLLVAHERGDPDALARSRRILDFMLQAYQPADRSPLGIRWMYGHDFERIKAPWWSGMDALFGPMVLHAAWQVTGEAAYREAALSSALLALRTPAEGGVLWRDADGSCWISEFSWNGIQRAEEFHVLNGHLWGLQSLYMLAAATGDRPFMEGYECARRGTLARLQQYYNPGHTWTWYQLVPKVINTSDYHLLELTQFRAMHELTGDDAWLPPLQARSRMMQQAYVPVLKRARSGALSVVLPRSGPPHPYSSLPQPVLRCVVQGQEREVRGGKPDPAAANAAKVVLELPVASAPSHCMVAFHSTVENPIFERRDLALVDERPTVAIDTQIDLALDAVSVQGRTVKVSPRFEAFPGEERYENNEARIGLSIEQPIGPFHHLVLSLRPTASNKLGIIVEDAAGRTSMRYLPPLRAGETNLIVLNRLGLPGNDAMATHIRRLSLRVFTEPGDGDSTISIERLSIARNPVELVTALEEAQPGYMPLD